MGIASQGTTPNREKHNLRMSSFINAHMHLPESEFNKQAQAAGSGSNLFPWLFLIKPNLNSDLYLKKKKKKMKMSKMPWNSEKRI